MKIGILEIGIGVAVLGFIASRSSSGNGGGSGTGSGGGGSGGGGGIVPLPGFLGGGGGGGGGKPSGPSGLGGTGTGSVPAPPKGTPESPFSWTQNTCLPIIHSVTEVQGWCRDFGLNAPKGLSAAQYNEYAVRGAMGSCYPPPADPVTAWGVERVPYFYEFYRVYLQGLRSGKRLGDDAVQTMLDQVRAWLVARGVDVSLLNPYVVSKY